MKEILERIQKNPGSINDELLATMVKPAKEAQQAAKTAFAAYHEDLKTRCDKLAQQGEEYARQLAEMQTKRAKMAAQINYLSSRGEIEKAAAIEDQIEAIDKGIASLERKKRIISAAEIKGDQQLYQEAKNAMDNYQREVKLFLKCVEQIKPVAEAEQNRLSNVIKAMSDTVHYHYMTSEFEMKKAFDKVEQNFRENK